MAQTDIRKQRFVAAAQEFAACLAEFCWDNFGDNPVTFAPQIAQEESAEPLLKLNEAARLMRVSVSTFKRKVQAGDIKPVNVTGKATRYRREDVDRLIRRLK